MNYKDRHRSFYYEGAEIADVDLPLDSTGLLIIDIQNYNMEVPSETENPQDYQRWLPFFTRMRETVIPNTGRLLSAFRAKNRPVFFARIAALRKDGSDRSLSQRRPGFNNLLLPADDRISRVVDDLKPIDDEIVVVKTTDSALTGTNLRLILHNMGVTNLVVCGIYTDQCVSCTVRSLADESVNVVVVEDACAAATDELHNMELKIMNNIYCQVLNTEETLTFINLP